MPEAVADLGRAGDPAGALEEGLAPGGGDAAAGAEQDGDRAGVVDAADVLAGNADGQVEEAVAVEVAGRQRRPEEVDRFGVVLGEELAAGAGEAAGGAVQDVDRAGERDAADRLVRHAHGDVEAHVAVEVALGDGGAEGVVMLGRAGHAAAALEEDVGAGLQPIRGPVQDVERPGARLGADGLTRGADREVGEPVAVEADLLGLLGPRRPGRAPPRATRRPSGSQPSWRPRKRLGASPPLPCPPRGGVRARSAGCALGAPVARAFVLLVQDLPS